MLQNPAVPTIRAGTGSSAAHSSDILAISRRQLSGGHDGDYSQEDGEGRNLQMVIKDCVPARSIMGLIEQPDDE